MSLFVGRVSASVRQKELEELFTKYGTLKRCDIKNNFAFVTFEDERDAEDAINGLKGAEIGGQTINVEWAKNSGRYDGPRRRRDSRRSRSRSRSRDRRRRSRSRDRNRRRRSRSRSRDRKRRSSKSPRRDRSKSRDRSPKKRRSTSRDRKRSKSPVNGDKPPQPPAADNGQTTEN